MYIFIYIFWISLRGAKVNLFFNLITYETCHKLLWILYEGRPLIDLKSGNVNEMSSKRLKTAHARITINQPIRRKRLVENVRVTLLFVTRW